METPNSVQILQSIIDAFPKSNFAMRWYRRTRRKLARRFTPKPLLIADIICRDYGVQIKVAAYWRDFLNDQTRLTHIGVDKVLHLAGRRSLENATDYTWEMSKILEVIHLYEEGI